MNISAILCHYSCNGILLQESLCAVHQRFSNWLKSAGASFDHLHKQLVALDDWGSSIHSQTEMLRKNPNVFNEFGANLASKLNLMIAK